MSGESSLEPVKNGSLYKVLLQVQDSLKFPSVKAQEFMMSLSEHGEVREMKPDLFDPALDESNRKFEFHVFAPHLLKELEQRIQSATSGDGEILSVVVEAFPEPKKAQELSSAEAMARQVRIDSRRLEELNRLAGELVILKEQVASVAFDLGKYSRYPELLDLSKSLKRTVHGFHDVAGAIQNRTREFQQVPIGSLLQRFQRVARDASRQLGKPIECIIEGAETEIDGGILERIGDLLVHLVRNAADHGIESPEKRKAAGKPEIGKITLEAYPEENHIVVEVSDDGAGMDPRKIGEKAMKLGMLTQEALEQTPEFELFKYIFRSGFSTTEQVGEISGRGVGLDVVKSRTEELNGILDFRTELGKGTTFIIRLPLSISIVQALLIESAEQTYALPLGAILRVLKIDASGQQQVARESQLRLADGVLKSWFLSRVLKNEQDFIPTLRKEGFLVELGFGVERYGLVVDRVVGRREIVIRGLSQVLGSIDGIQGMASLGDGTVVVVLDPRKLFEVRIPKIGGKSS